jgi:hypothetical protein
VTTRSTWDWATLPWRCRWNLVRLAAAAFVAWVLAADSGARLARLQMAALPDFDYAAEVRSLRLEGRYGEALMLADAGMKHATGRAREDLLCERGAAAAEQDSFLRMAKDAGAGAITGSGRSLEGLVGAVAADMLVLGDVRDLLIQAGRLLIEGEGDEVILGLSIIGIVTTLAPEFDWAPSILKAARRTGNLGDRLGGELLRLMKDRRTDELRAALGSVADLGRGTSPGTAARAVRHAENTDDLRALADLAVRHPQAGLMLHVAGPEALRAARAGPAHIAALARASRKGPAGVRLLQTTGRALTRPHPLLGIAKTLWKGNADDLITRLTDRLDPSAWWLLPASAAWCLIEVALLLRKVGISPKAP